jgi:hypothetical protein
MMAFHQAQMLSQQCMLVVGSAAAAGADKRARTMLDKR